jgi:hypothetical protein
LSLVCSVAAHSSYKRVYKCTCIPFVFKVLFTLITLFILFFKCFIFSDLLIIITASAAPIILSFSDHPRLHFSHLSYLFGLLLPVKGLPSVSFAPFASLTPVFDPIIVIKKRFSYCLTLKGAVHMWSSTQAITNSFLSS